MPAPDLTFDEWNACLEDLLGMLDRALLPSDRADIHSIVESRKGSSRKRTFIAVVHTTSRIVGRWTSQSSR